MREENAAGFERNLSMCIFLIFTGMASVLKQAQAGESEAGLKSNFVICIFSIVADQFTKLRVNVNIKFKQVDVRKILWRAQKKPL